MEIERTAVIRSVVLLGVGAWPWQPSRGPILVLDRTLRDEMRVAILGPLFRLKPALPPNNPGLMRDSRGFGLWQPLPPGIQIDAGRRPRRFVR